MGSAQAQNKQAAARTGCSSVEEWKAKRAAGLQWCYLSRHWVARSRFYKDRHRSTGLASVCKTCANHKSTASRYGLSLEEVRKARSSEAECAICGRKKKLEVDHCHESGRVRGLLCRRCNGGLGQFGDSAEALRKAVAYLENSTHG